MTNSRPREASPQPPRVVLGQYPGDAPQPAPSDTIRLHCPKCPRGLAFWRRPLRTYRRVMPWAGNPQFLLARFRCDGCGFEVPLTADWIKELLGRRGW